MIVRPAAEADFDGWFALHAAVAAEGKWIGRELPVDREVSRHWFLEHVARPEDPHPNVGFVAVIDGAQVGQLGLQSHGGIGELGMAVDARWRGRGVGSALMAAAIVWACDHDLHKLALQLWPHNTPALRLYQKFGFVEEGRLYRQYRRRNGELWDAIVMGLVLDTTSPGSSEGTDNAVDGS